MRLLLASGGYRTQERIAHFAGELRSLFGDIGRVLFIPYAVQDHDAPLRAFAERGLSAGYRLDGIHHHADPRAAVRDAEAIFVGGGNTFRLLNELYQHDLLDIIRERVREGMPYVGTSAGSNVACPTIKTTNDMPITLPPSLGALGLVPFQINPHYFSGQVYVNAAGAFHEHLGETRDDRIREFHEMNDAPVVGLWEGACLRVNDAQVLLVGAPARVFRRGHEPADMESGMLLHGLIQ